MLPLDAVTAIRPVVSELGRLGVRCYLGGSIASSAYGVPRSTLDADIIADLAPQHAAPLVEALRSDYYVSSSALLDAIVRRTCCNLIHLTTSFKVDVFPVKDRAYDHAALLRIREIPVDREDPSSRFSVAAPEDIVLSKLQWYRLGEEVSETQWRDVMGVLKVQSTALDRSYLQQWAPELGIADLLEKAWREADL